LTRNETASSGHAHAKRGTVLAGSRVPSSSISSAASANPQHTESIWPHRVESIQATGLKSHTIAGRQCQARCDAASDSPHQPRVDDIHNDRRKLEHRAQEQSAGIGQVGRDQAVEPADREQHHRIARRIAGKGMKLPGRRVALLNRPAGERLNVVGVAMHLDEREPQEQRHERKGEE
jgi:hypothetical protein